MACPNLVSGKYFVAKYLPIWTNLKNKFCHNEGNYFSSDYWLSKKLSYVLFAQV